MIRSGTPWLRRPLCEIPIGPYLRRKTKCPARCRTLQPEGDEVPGCHSTNLHGKPETVLHPEASKIIHPVRTDVRTGGKMKHLVLGIFCFTFCNLAQADTGRDPCVTLTVGELIGYLAGLITLFLAIMGFFIWRTIQIGF
jgi:hypothetical protein